MDDDGNELDEVTWCVDCIYEHDVMYVLPDTHSPTTVGAVADICPDCGGRGVIAYQGQGKYECSKCEGNGQV